MKTIVFNESTKSFILSLFDKSIDDEGYIIEDSTKTRVLTPSGDEVLAKNFAGFTPGSEIVLTKDLPSLLQFASSGVTTSETSGQLKALL